jgi:hypothetical protein
MAAPLYQLLVRTDSPSIYYKSGTANTAWTMIGTSGGSGGTGTIAGSAEATYVAVGVGSQSITPAAGSAAGSAFALFGNGYTVRFQGDTWIDVATGAAVSLGSGVNSDVNFYGSAAQQSLVLVNPWPVVTPGLRSDTTDTTIDGILADATGVSPISGGFHMWCQEATNHGCAYLMVNEGSVSNAANRLDINDDGNFAGVEVGMCHRQCVVGYYNPTTVNKWQFAMLGDGEITGRFAFNPHLDDLSLPASVSNYRAAAAGSAAVPLCGVTMMRWASASTTTMHNWATCDAGAVKIVRVFSGGITVNNEDTTSIGTGSVFDLNQTGANKTLVNGCTYTFIMDNANGWMMIGASGPNPSGC